MRDLSQDKVNEAISRAGIKIGELKLNNPEKFFSQKEEIIVSEIKLLGITENEPLFETVRLEFYRVINFCPD